MPVFDHFDFLAPFYERFIPPKDPEDLWAAANLPARGALLDAGGGTGRVAQFMRSKTDLVVVADLSHQMLTQAQAKDGLLPVCSQAEKLPFPDGYFARIIMVDALHHVIDQPTTLQELWRTLQPGGRLVIEEPDLRHFAVKMIAVAEKLAWMRSHFLTPAQIAKLMSFPDAQVQVKTAQFNACVIADKNRPAG